MIKTINIVGVGSLGSWTTLLLSKMARGFGWKLNLYDFDDVQTHNLRNQLFRAEDVGRKKVFALQDIIGLLNSESVKASVKKIDCQSSLNGIVIVLVHSMKDRKEIFERLRYHANIPLLIEARSGGDVAIIYAFDPRDIDCVEKYKETLYSDSQAVAAPCADEQTIDTIWAIASVIGKILSLFMKQKLNGFMEILINYEELPIVSRNATIATIRKLFEKDENGE